MDIETGLLSLAEAKLKAERAWEENQRARRAREKPYWEEAARRRVLALREQGLMTGFATWKNRQGLLEYVKDLEKRLGPRARRPETREWLEWAKSYASSVEVCSYPPEVDSIEQFYRDLPGSPG